MSKEISASFTAIADALDSTATEAPAKWAFDHKKFWPQHCKDSWGSARTSVHRIHGTTDRARSRSTAVAVEGSGIWGLCKAIRSIPCLGM